MQCSEKASTMQMYTIFSLFKVNQIKVNNLFMQIQCALSLTDGILIFYSGINYQKDDVTYLLGFWFLNDVIS